MKFLFEKFNIPNTIGRYGSGDIAVRAIAHFPYLFIIDVTLSTFFWLTRQPTSTNIYFFPKKNPIVAPIVEPKTTKKMAKETLSPATIVAARTTKGETICGNKSRIIAENII